MNQPKAVKGKGKDDLVSRLSQTLYALKQDPRQWYLKFDSFMVGKNFSRCEFDQFVYYKSCDNGEFVLFLL